jgi:predicted amino acid-binding ACT domain protein
MNHLDSPLRKQFVITVLAHDRVGIIADVSCTISQLEGDIADLRESMVRGYRTMLLLATFPASLTLEAIRALARARRRGRSREWHIGAQS